MRCVDARQDRPQDSSGESEPDGGTTGRRACIGGLRQQSAEAVLRPPRAPRMHRERPRQRDVAPVAGCADGRVRTQLCRARPGHRHARAAAQCVPWHRDTRDRRQFLFHDQRARDHAVAAAQALSLPLPALMFPAHLACARCLRPGHHARSRPTRDEAADAYLFRQGPCAQHGAGYAVGNALLQNISLPGVFEHLPTPRHVNGSLWTLPIEATMYFCLAGLGLLRCFRFFRG